RRRSRGARGGPRRARPGWRRRPAGAGIRPEHPPRRIRGRLMTITENDERARRKKALLAERLRTARAVPAGPQPRAEGAAVPLTPAQRRLWISERMGEPSAAYSVGFGLRLTGRLDIARLDEAISAV